MSPGTSWRLLVVPTVLLATAAFGCGRSSADPGLAGGLLRRAPFERRLLLSGQLEAERAAGLQVPATPAGNVQIRWIEREGSEVQAGDRVVELDPSELLQGLAERESEQLTATDELQRLRAQGKTALEVSLLANAQAAAELAKARMGADIPPELVSARELAERLLRLEKAQAAVAKAAAQLAAARAADDADVGVQELTAAKVDRALGETRRNLELLTLRAPRAGVVVVGSHPWEGRKFQAGDAVWPGFPLVTLPELDSLVLVAELSDVDDGRLAAGMRGRCVLDAFPESPVECSVREIAPMAQEVARLSLRRAFRAVVTLAKVDSARFRPGMSARAEIVVESSADALLVDRAAIDFPLPAVSAVSAGSVPAPVRVQLESGELRAVTLGACNARECVVQEGLTGGERLAPVGAASAGEAR